MKRWLGRGTLVATNGGVHAVLDAIRLAAMLARPPRPGGRSGQADTAIAVLVEPSDEDWEAARELGARIVLVPEETDRALAVQAVPRGADALLPAAQAPARLLETVELVAAGHALVDPALFRKLGVRNRAEAVAAAHARQLLGPDVGA